MSKPHLESIESILEAAKSYGRFGLFEISSLSYYPTDRVADLIMQNVYGVNRDEGIFASQRYNERKKQGQHLIDPSTPLQWSRSEGTFLYLIDGEVERGLLDIKSIESPDPRVNLSIISANALFSHQHQIESVGIPQGVREGNYNAIFYTIDQDGSKWSIHCRR